MANMKLKPSLFTPRPNNDMLSEALPDPPMLIDGWKIMVKGKTSAFFRTMLCPIFNFRVGDFFDLKKKKSKKSDLFDLNQISFI